MLATLRQRLPHLVHAAALLTNSVVIVVGANLLFAPRRARGAAWVMAALVGWGLLSSLALALAGHERAPAHTQRRLHRIAGLLNSLLLAAALLFGLLSAIEWPLGAGEALATLALLVPPALNLWALRHAPTA